ncbi:MAG TPA: bifunctional hydroxymethylpyrimidine kinase/phosphomethylpyrimidine kinase [Polyangiaceae bacterium LLY-WYZ-15_(1-7)]|nr:bifunctional hydroxymethylpyrimidine kinase/phosphomethylpyrimidine kinase [Sandaracinus sp.]HJK92712.1 bifunctional hydroxymethylpyrimidine kinase/phosphomethylpyrimidine kinase [Polyangiaceae bacterium LLY-WYZ-15_(1-7)]MBJ73424.1 bifunctional hydroxymethylpyrimidine kinase/phosphomethylpyrimidine kinase [Sandaracinus sp.]HJL01232.1 bifunctional hydroxymethylpyrimidine kinase/phosphomethylpyrimidine kinase [Polyangiaceae bacterium LLY-WYZ-15_(1-7)]HJL10083.1 bifunctional hydroxymethylpyrimi
MTAIALTIAGSDPSGGAGIQADLKTFHQHRVYGTSVLTLLTVQNTQRVSAVEVMAPELVRAQLEAVLEDVPPAAAKTGALGSAAVVEAVAEMAAGFAFPLVVDPVMISKHGAPLMDEAARAAFPKLLARAALVTPNAHEAAALVGRPVETLAQAEDAAKALLDRGAKAALVKGGHVGEGGAEAVDVLATGAGVERFRAPRVDTKHTHGTGCTSSSAITARLARGEALEEAIRGAKAWLTEALRRAPGVGKGIGPVDHFAPVPD